MGIAAFHTRLDYSFTASVTSLCEGLKLKITGLNAGLNYDEFFWFLSLSFIRRQQNNQIQTITITLAVEVLGKLFLMYTVVLLLQIVPNTTGLFTPRDREIS